MIFQRREKRDGNNFYTSNVKIDIVQSYSYLETQISSSGNFTLSLENLRERLFMLASTSAVGTHLLLTKLLKLLTQWFHLFWLLITKPGVSLSNQSSSIGTLHRMKKVTYSFVDAICKWRWYAFEWITRLIASIASFAKSRPAAHGPRWPDGPVAQSSFSTVFFVQR